MRAALFVAALATLCHAISAHESLKVLPHLPIDPDSVTVSGLSAGAFMAVQFHVAFSASVHSAGVIAGGPYYCAGGSFEDVYKCMSFPEALNLQPIFTQAQQYAQSGAIDGLGNLTDQNVWLYSGTKDTVVNQQVMEKLKEFYSHYIQKGVISTDFTEDAEHGFPTLNYGNPCTKLGSPFILKCNYDAAGKILQTAYGTLAPASAPIDKNVLSFDQGAFGSDNNLAANGYIYIPTACRGSSGADSGNSNSNSNNSSSSRAVQCKLHIAFHGCEQSYEFINTEYVENTGYNGYAEANNIVVLYPQSSKNALKENPNGCFDWWGYSGSDYATKTGAQMAAIKQMVDTLIGA